MRRKTPTLGFTLMEILVVISILGILAIGIAQVDFSRLSQNQRIQIEATKILNIVEEVRNNALIGRGVGVDLNTPDSWSVVFENDSSSGSVTSYYHSGSTSFTGSVWKSPIPFLISSLECRQLDETVDTSSGPFTLVFTGSVGGITGCSDSSYKKLNFIYGGVNFSRNISINTLSGIIEID
ncbi:prepilin-type N-terminal cleavage/methylation domain-containing protein [Candidatus Gracilibacteria bacterium]|nr:prepilin-type N-terminal cleavage/methylation domain-containing protein [Candidatus Gracilibacteria bacterium]